MKRTLCAICNFHRVHEVDARIRDGSLSTRAIAGMYRVSYDSLKRHVANGHVAPRVGVAATPKTPAPFVAPVMTVADEERAASAEERWAAMRADQVGIDAADLLACWRSDPPHDEDECPTCATFTQADIDLMNAIEATL